jgi:hypothetical protein
MTGKNALLEMGEQRFTLLVLGLGEQDHPGAYSNAESSRYFTPPAYSSHTA